jgi:hypothetical protein
VLRHPRLTLRHLHEGLSPCALSENPLADKLAGMSLLASWIDDSDAVKGGSTGARDAGPARGVGPKWVQNDTFGPPRSRKIG